MPTVKVAMKMLATFSSASRMSRPPALSVAAPETCKASACVMSPLPLLARRVPLIVPCPSITDVPAATSSARVSRVSSVNAPCVESRMSRPLSVTAPLSPVSICASSASFMPACNGLRSPVVASRANTTCAVAGTTGMRSKGIRSTEPGCKRYGSATWLRCCSSRQPSTLLM